MFYILGAVYFVMMLIGHFLLKKPDGWVEDEKLNNSFKLRELLKDKTFIGIWLMFYINIHCGLALITYEKQILSVSPGILRRCFRHGKESGRTAPHHKV